MINYYLGLATATYHYQNTIGFWQALLFEKKVIQSK